MYRRLPNNYGTITKLKGNRRKPFRARKRIGEKYDDEKRTTVPVYATVGYYETRDEALRSLALYNGDAEAEKEITLADCYELWKAEYELKKPLNISYVSAWNKYLTPIADRPIASLKTIDLETVVNAKSVPSHPKTNCAVVLHGIFGYAMRHEIISKDYSRIAKFIYEKNTESPRKIFTTEEINSLWGIGTVWSEITLVLLYTGFRIAELLGMPKSNVHIEERYMVGGLKTEAGKNRIVPIHSAIVPIIEKWYGTSKKYICEHKGKSISKDIYRYHLIQFAPNHSAHDARHTFITQAYRCGIPEPEIKRIVGHSLNGVTQSVYIHLDCEHLRAELEKLQY